MEASGDPAGVPGAAAVDAQHPWPGLLPFTEEGSAFFRGRETETSELYHSVKRAALTILYGKSGLGKTSLLQAGLFPRLREEDYLPIYLRLDHSPDSPPPAAQAKSLIVDALKQQQVTSPAMRDGMTLWEFFHRRETAFWKEDFLPVTPVLVFDQFEEIFTIGRTSLERGLERDEFLVELRALVENDPPKAVRLRLDADPSQAVEFTQECLNYKLLLCLREDFLADLEDLATLMPSLRHNRLSLKPLNGLQAEAVVLQPEARLVEPELAPRIVRFVAASGGRAAATGPEADADSATLEVESALLSLFCRELNNRRIEAGRATISGDLVDERVGKQILRQFYEDAFSDVPPAVRHFIEDELVTVDGYRDSEDLGSVYRQPGFTPEVVRKLVAKRLIRIEEHHGAKKIELTHDVLTGLVRSSRELREARVAEEKARQEQLEAEVREQERARQLRKARLSIVGTGVACLLFFALACLAWRLWRESEHANANAEKARIAAVEALGREKKSSAELVAALASGAAATEEAQASKERAFESMRAIVSAGQELVGQVVSDELGLPTTGALRLLGTAEGLYEQIDDKRLPQVIESRVRLEFARAESFLKSTGERTFDERALEALTSIDKAIGTGTRAVQEFPQQIEWHGLLSDAHILKGDILFRLAQVAGAREAPSDLAPQTLLQRAYTSYGSALEVLEIVVRGSRIVDDSDAKSANEEARQFLRDADLRLARAHNKAGDVLRKLDRSDEAISHFDVARDLMEEALSRRSIASPLEVRSTLADTYNKTGNIYADRANALARKERTPILDRALREYQKAYDIREGLAAQEPEKLVLQRDFAISCANMGGAYLALAHMGEARAEKARPFLRKRLEIDEALFERDPDNVYWRDALAEGCKTYAEHLLDAAQFNDPSLAVDFARRAVTLTQERNLDFLRVYLETLRKTRAGQEAKRIESVMAELRKSAAKTDAAPAPG